MQRALPTLSLEDIALALRYAQNNPDEIAYWIRYDESDDDHFEAQDERGFGWAYNVNASSVYRACSAINFHRVRSFRWCFSRT